MDAPHNSHHSIVVVAPSKVGDRQISEGAAKVLQAFQVDQQTISGLELQGLQLWILQRAECLLLPFQT